MKKEDHLQKEQAKRICIAALRACTTDYGFIAGTDHFVDIWARDCLFASFGANVSGFADISKRTIQSFLVFLRTDGLVPYVLMRSRMGLGKYFGNHSYYPSPVPHFRSHQSGGIVPDGGLMTIVAAAEYLEVTGDTEFIHKNFDRLTHTLRWYEDRFKQGLIHEWFLCEWADAVLKFGNTFYTNVLYWKASESLCRIANAIGKKRQADQYKNKQQHLLRLIHTVFWNGTYFADWRDFKRQDYFASHANMLAIVLGLAGAQESQSILDYAAKHCWNGWTLETNYPKYPIYRIPMGNYLVGMADYHNRGCLWMQPGILYALAQKKTGNTKEAQAILGKISHKIIEYDGAYEVYEKNGVPVSRRWYRSEGPFAWSAGLFLWAHHIIEA